MKRCTLPLLLAACVWSQAPAQHAQQPAASRPRAGKPPILRASEVKAGMKATAWTVFEGNTPEPVPIEILGVMKNAWGPKQDIILGKMGGRAQRTNVAGGMSGSPVYVDGKLMGAVSLRMSVFSPDAICGITPIELMLEINDFDESRPTGARTPGASQPRAAIDVPQGFAQASGGGELSLTPIDTPLVFSGFHEATLREFGGMFRQMGINPAQGGASGAALSARLSPGWQSALQPGDAVSGVLVSGDVNMSAMGTVTYNDGKRVLAFGHPFLSLGPVAMPMAKSEVVWTLASAFQPGKIGNATDIVGTLRQDRHSGIMGVLGEQAEMIPCSLKVRSLDSANSVRKEKDLHFDVFVQQKWTPFLMMVTLFNAVQSLNEFADEATYRISGSVDLDGGGKISLNNMFSPTEMPTPVPMQLAFWYGDKFNRLFLNSVRNPKLKGVDLTLDLLPDRRVAAIESAFADSSEVNAGSELPVKVYLRPYRGGRIERQIKVKVPAGFPKGEHRILLSDADTLNRVQSFAGAANRFIDIPQTVNLLNQERTNNKLYVSLVQGRPTVYVEDKTMPSLPPSVANVMQNGRSASRSYFTTPETADEQMALPFDVQVTGSYSLRVKVN
ncbi:MAG: hypothetical protein U0Q16_15895 [Bryobacteraceae bacterium]